jgi:tripartite-type tricarboxylate transporter receptor subunit TctC
VPDHRISNEEFPMTFTRRDALTAGAGLLGAMTLPARAAAYPDKPVKMVVGFAAGGGADIIAREVGLQMGNQMKESIIVENKPGATGTIAATYVARSQPDGYTLFLGSQSTMLVAPAIYPKLQFDPVKDFIPVSMLVSMPMILVVNPAVPVKNMKELLALARSKPGLPYASAGSGGPQHVAGELFGNQAHVKLTHVPYKGEAPALADCMGGQVPMMFSNLPTVMPYIQAGKLRPIAISSLKRDPSHPDIPTVAESAALPGFEVLTWYALFAPAGTPAAVTRRIQDEAITALRTRELSAKLADQGFTVVGSSQQQFTNVIKTEVPRWNKLVKEANIKGE